MPDTATAKKTALNPQQNGMLSVLDFLVQTAETLFRTRSDSKMEAASKAQEELQKIETQIEQLQAAAGSNQEAQKQLAALRARVESLRRQISGQLTPWERTELARHSNRPY